MVDAWVRHAWAQKWPTSRVVNTTGSLASGDLLNSHFFLKPGPHPAFCIAFVSFGGGNFKFDLGAFCVHHIVFLTLLSNVCFAFRTSSFQSKISEDHRLRFTVPVLRTLGGCFLLVVFSYFRTSASDNTVTCLLPTTARSFNKCRQWKAPANIQHLRLVGWPLRHGWGFRQ